MSISTEYTDSTTSVHASVCAPKCNTITTVALAILALGAVLTVAGFIFTSPVIIPGIICLAVGALVLTIGCCIPRVSISSRSYDEPSCGNTGVAYIPTHTNTVVYQAVPSTSTYYVPSHRGYPGSNPAPSSREVGGQGNPLRPSTGVPSRFGTGAADIRARGNAHGGAVVVETRRPGS